MKEIFKILLITLLLFLSIDFLFGKKIIKSLESNNVFFSFDFFLKQNIKNEKKFRIKNKYFSHSLRENYKGKSYFGTEMGSICTDKYGFKTNCKNIDNTNEFDYIFLGDSVIEGVGSNYENSFVGIFENSTNLKVANLAVSGYSPIIHYHKLKFFLNNGIKTDHVIIYLDVSDVNDEVNRYECNGKVCENNNNKTDFRSKDKLFNLKNLIKNDLKITLNLMQYSKKFFCKNFLIGYCSYIYDRNFMSTWINDFDNKIGPSGIYEKSLKQQVFYLDKIYNLLKSLNIKFSIGIYPWPGNILYNENIDAYQNYWKNYCVNKCNLFINHFEDFQHIKNISKKKDIIKKIYIYGDMHFNAKGNQILANKLIKTIFNK